MGSRSGSQVKHWAEKARVWAWYAEVKRRTYWSDYRLDKEFARKPGAALNPDLPAKVFYEIRKNARQPVGNKDWRSVRDLVVAVESHPSFEGTQDLYDADIWNLLQEHYVEAEVLASRLEALLEHYSLVQIDALASDDFSATALQLGLPALYDRALKLSLHNLPQLDQFTLLWNLYLATEQSSDWQIRKLLESRLDRWLDIFFFEHFAVNGLHLEFYTAAIDALLKARINPNTKVSALQYLGTISRRLILPLEQTNIESA